MTALFTGETLHDTGPHMLERSCMQGMSRIRAMNRVHCGGGCGWFVRAVEVRLEAKFHDHSSL
jgi:hypothetical protein